DTDLAAAVDMVASLGPKRMLNVFHQNDSPDMLAVRLPEALIIHEQATAQLLDELGEWLRSPDGGGFLSGVTAPEGRVPMLNAAVAYLFSRLQAEVAKYDGRQLITFLVSQNEALTR